MNCIPICSSTVTSFVRNSFTLMPMDFVIVFISYSSESSLSVTSNSGKVMGCNRLLRLYSANIICTDISTIFENRAENGENEIENHTSPNIAQTAIKTAPPIIIVGNRGTDLEVEESMAKSTW